MKTLLASLLLVPLLFGQNEPTTAAAPGCGPADGHFQVKTEKQQHPAMQPDAGKALVYFVEDDRRFFSTPKPTTRLGIDGQWVGATHGNSYLFTSVDPGERHLCATWQSWIGPGSGHMAAAAHFTAEAGKVYYFRAKNTFAAAERDRNPEPPELELALIDSDEGQLLASQFAFSISQPK